MSDPVQALKNQIGELVWNIHVLQSQLEEANKERDDLKKKLEDKNGSASSKR